MKKIIFVAILVFAVASFASCGGKTKNKYVESVATENVPEQYLIHPDSYHSISILKGEENILLDAEATTVVIRYINSGHYDEERNDSGIKYKMAEPDYTFLFDFKDGRKEVVQYWVESALILYGAKWYLPISAANIKDTLDKYTKED